MPHHSTTKCLLLNESMIDEAQFDIDPIGWREDRCYAPGHIDEFRYEIEFQLNMILDRKKLTYCHVLGFCSERLEVTHLDPAAAVSPCFLQPGASWEDTVIRIARHFGGPDARRDDVVFEQFERQQRQFREALKLLKRDIKCLRLNEERDEAQRLKAKRDTARAPMLRGFQRPDALTTDPFHQAIDLRADHFLLGEHLLLEVALAC